MKALKVLFDRIFSRKDNDNVEAPLAVEEENNNSVYFTIRQDFATLADYFELAIVECAAMVKLEETYRQVQKGQADFGGFHLIGEWLQSGELAVDYRHELFSAFVYYNRIPSDKLTKMGQARYDSMKVWLNS